MVMKKQKVIIRYTDSDIKFLKDNYHNSNLEELSSKLGRSKVAVYQKARLLGIDTKKKNLVSKPVETEEVKQISFTIHGIDIVMTFK
jgi:hypothetical protein